jgi:hypothetical protein
MEIKPLVHRWGIAGENAPHWCDSKSVYYHTPAQGDFKCCSMSWEDVTCVKCLKFKELKALCGGVR